MHCFDTPVRIQGPALQLLKRATVTAAAAVVVAASWPEKSS